MGTIHAHHRILITGTPLQNNLLEIWNLMDWLCDHRLLGKKEEFTRHFRTPIEEGQDKKASDEVQLTANGVGDAAAREERGVQGRSESDDQQEDGDRAVVVV